MEKAHYKSMAIFHSELLVYHIYHIYHYINH
jgi:hypothetical protein